jgi:hypothetical protein
LHPCPQEILDSDMQEYIRRFGTKTSTILTLSFRTLHSSAPRSLELDPNAELDDPVIGKPKDRDGLSRV